MGVDQRGRTSIGDLLTRARAQFDELTGLTVESVSHVERAEDGWRVTFDVVELARVPRSTDVLACYDVDLDTDGEPVAWRRTRRYLRSEHGTA